MVQLKFRYFIYTGIIFLMGCQDTTKVTNIQNQWSGLNPTSIPLSVRIKEEQKGNLITNPSFELGKQYTLDSTNLSFNLPGWKKLGENVYWVDIENKSEYEEKDASSGNHAIKIVRAHSDETEVQGEGIMSDYIRVIPGNYILSLDIRLEHISSNLDRLGTGVYDAVNLRVFCYDRNKVMIRNVSYHPLYNKKIDNSFKGFSFSNHEKIDQFGWARIYGRAGNFPFEEGTLPEETRYVKVFAGLKGEGTMWVDKFDFRYSEKNFTLREKLEPYFDSTMEKSSYLIPLPQKAAYYKPFDLIMSDNEEQILPRILFPTGADKSILSVLRDFNNSIFAGILPATSRNRFLSDLKPTDLEDKGLIFSFGNNSLSNQFVDQLSFDEIQNLEQAYFIDRLEQFDNVIFIGYSDMEGLQHALHTLQQLFDLDNNLYHHYDIIDHPDYRKRGALIPNPTEDFDPGVDEAFRRLNQVGINTWVYETGTVELGSDKLFSSLENWTGLNVRGEFFPYVRKGISLEKLKLPDLPMDFKESDAKEISLYKSRILESADELYRSIQKLNSLNTELMIFSDKTLWESMNFSSAGAFLLNNQNFNKFMFYRNLFSRALSDYDLEKLPESYLIPFYQGLSRKENLYYDIYSDAIADSMVNQWFTTVLWSGAVKNASLVDPMDLYGIKGTPDLSLLDYSLSYQTGSKYFGNFYSLYPGKALTGVLFKPYDTRITGIDPEDFNSEVLLKLNDFSEITRIRLSTAADYFWNTSAYDPAKSLWKTLIYYFGKEVAIELVIFNDLYFKLLSISLNMELNGYSQKHEKQANELIIELNTNWDNIQIMLEDNISFLNDLSDLKNTIISRYYEAQKNSHKEGPPVE